MGKAVSTDLRLRMVRGIASGKSRRAVAAQFEVAPSTAVRVQARYAATSSVEPARQGRPKGSGKLGPYRQAIVDKVKAKPDITMPDLAVWLEAQHGVSADPTKFAFGGAGLQQVFLASKRGEGDDPGGCLMTARPGLSGRCETPFGYVSG